MNDPNPAEGILTKRNTEKHPLKEWKQQTDVNEVWPFHTS